MVRAFGWLVLCASCVQSPTPAPDATGLDANLVAQALTIADEYRRWGRVDDELRWAPFLCRQPLPGVARLSDSTHPGTHGQKLYSVWARHREQYPTKTEVGQVLVKESFVAVPDPTARFEPARAATPAPIDADHFYPYATKNGAVYRAGDPAGLFIMHFAGPDAKDTDEGWLYFTVSPRRDVTGVGKIASCIECHDHAPHGRLFGLPPGP
jgi:hypothetical protein